MGVTSDKERIHRWITQADLERMLSDAYQRGAEAMREAAALRCEVSPTHGVPTSMSYSYAAMVRALPMPKDKP